MITSSSNAQVKNIIALNKKAKERREQDVFVAEGWKMFQEAPREWLKKVYVSESGSKMHEMPSDGTEYEVVDDRVFQSMCDTKTPQGVLSMIRMPHYTEEEVMDNGKTPLLMVLEDLQDPGNVGTIIRTAEGAGVTGIIMSRGTADIFNPKTIRSTMGSIYRMPFRRRCGRICKRLKSAEDLYVRGTSARRAFLPRGGLHKRNGIPDRK